MQDFRISNLKCYFSFPQHSIENGISLNSEPWIIKDMLMCPAANFQLFSYETECPVENHEKSFQFDYFTLFDEQTQKKT